MKSLKKFIKKIPKLKVEIKDEWVEAANPQELYTLIMIGFVTMIAGFFLWALGEIWTPYL